LIANNTAVFGFISTTYFDLLSLVIFLSLGLAFFDWFTWKLHVEKTPVLFAIYDVSRAFLFLFFGLIAIFFGFDFVSFMLAISLAYFVMPVLRIFKGFIHSFKKNHYDDVSIFRIVFKFGASQALLFSSIPAYVAAIKLLALNVTNTHDLGGSFFLVVDLSILILGTIFYSVFFAIRPFTLNLDHNDVKESSSSIKNSIFETVLFASVPWLIFLFFMVPLIERVIFNGKMFDSGMLDLMDLSFLLLSIYLLFFKSFYIDLPLHSSSLTFLSPLTSYLGLILFMGLSHFANDFYMSDLIVNFFISVSLALLMSVYFSFKIQFKVNPFPSLMKLFVFILLTAVLMSYAVEISRSAYLSMFFCTVSFAFMFLLFSILVNLYRARELSLIVLQWLVNGSLK